MQGGLKFRATAAAEPCKFEGNKHRDAETQRHGDGTNFLCVSVPLRLCILVYSIIYCFAANR